MRAACICASPPSTHVPSDLSSPLLSLLSTPADCPRAGRGCRCGGLRGYCVCCVGRRRYPIARCRLPHTRTLARLRNLRASNPLMTYRFIVRSCVVSTLAHHSQIDGTALNCSSASRESQLIPPPLYASETDAWSDGMPPKGTSCMMLTFSGMLQPLILPSPPSLTGCIITQTNVIVLCRTKASGRNVFTHPVVFWAHLCTASYHQSTSDARQQIGH